MNTKELIIKQNEISTINPIKTNQFIVDIVGGNNFNIKPYEIVSFAETKNNLYSDIRLTINNVKDIFTLKQIEHSLLPKFMINKRDKHMIKVSIIDGKFNEIYSAFYRNCVLRKMVIPEFTYLKDDIIIIKLKFEFSHKETIFNEEYVKSLNIVIKEELEKFNKIYYNTEKMLDSALSNAKAHYDKTKDVETFLKIQEQINGCKKENDAKVRFLNTELKIK